MATKPTVRIPVWSSTGTKTDPGAGKEASGWSIAEKPPAYWFNWLLNAVGQWLGWAEDSIDELKPGLIRAAGTVRCGATPAIFANYKIDSIDATNTAFLTVATVPGVIKVGTIPGVVVSHSSSQSIYNLSATSVLLDGSGGYEFRLAATNSNTGALINHTSTAVLFDFIVFGDPYP